MNGQQQRRLIESLCNPGCYAHPVQRIELIETHISWVILTGSYAYKLKKGVDFGFLDYSTLEKRRTQCEQELELNRRTAAQLYLEVVPIGGSPERPQLQQQPAIEYAVKMRQFPQQSLLSQYEKRGELDKEAILALADTVAAFHATTTITAADSPYGTPQSALYPVNENFEQIRERIDAPLLLSRLDRLERQSRDYFTEHRERFFQRKQQGMVRDCHGDLHLNNILLLEGRPLLFDCIEFNPSLRIIDVISEVAFLVMDLDEHRRQELANLFLNRYLENNGDYEGLRLMPFYLGYRAMVRAKVAVLRLDQQGLSPTQREAVLRDFSTYLELAESYARPSHPRLLITHGVSGSGKTTLTQPLLERPGLVRTRSDVERKRLFGLASLDSSGIAGVPDIYTAEASMRTYDRLLQLAESALAGGYSVIVDATFLQREERERFRQLARRCNVPFTILSFMADAATLYRRVHARTAAGGDASEADINVLQTQLANYQPLANDEAGEVMIIDSEKDSVVELE